MEKQLRAIVFALTLIALELGHGGRLSAQSNSPGMQSKTIDCSVDGAQYTCTRADLLRTFAEARTIALESQPTDRLAEGQMRSFARSLTKVVVPGHDSADITLRLVRTQPTGMSVGSFDVDLATLRVFSTVDGRSKGDLLWVERYRGQQDVPWPSIVQALTGQLQATLAGH